MFLYDWQSRLVYLDVPTQLPVYYMPTAFYLPPPASTDSLIPAEEALIEPAGEFPQAEQAPAETAPARTSRNTHRSLQSIGRSSRSHHKKNIRNIIPNLARKILGFISSEESRPILEQSFPGLGAVEIAQYYEYVQRKKASTNFYIGNRDLTHIWYDPEGRPDLLRITRVLSKWFLENECVSSIVLSKRMKASLKIEHLRYRHKILAILHNGGKNQRTLIQ